MITEADLPSKEDEKIPEFRITDYALVATMSRDGVIVLWEWLPREKAREHALKTYGDGNHAL